MAAKITKDMGREPGLLCSHEVPVGSYYSRDPRFYRRDIPEGPSFDEEAVWYQTSVGAVNLTTGCHFSHEDRDLRRLEGRDPGAVFRLLDVEIKAKVRP